MSARFSEICFDSTLRFMFNKTKQEIKSFFKLFAFILAFKVASY